LFKVSYLNSRLTSHKLSRTNELYAALTDGPRGQLSNVLYRIARQPDSGSGTPRIRTMACVHQAEAICEATFLQVLGTEWSRWDWLWNS